MPRLVDVITALDGWFDPRWAESWDAIGLVCGDPAEQVDRILLAVDAVPATIAETIATGSQLLITHHPLLLSAVHGVPADDPKGGMVHRLIRADAAHFVAHTNADVARPGVSDALAACFGLTNTVPLEAHAEQTLFKLVVFVPEAPEAPEAAVTRLIDALAAAGAGAIGDYDRCAWTMAGEGTFRPLAGANPAVGSVHATESLPERRVEMVVPGNKVDAVVAALRAAHPYEEPAFDLLSQRPVPTRRGTGRVGELPSPMTLRDFTAMAGAVLPATAWGVRASGDPNRRISRVAVCGGTGGSLTEQARAAGADVFLTSDLKHHATLEAVAERGGDGMALVDAAHWATEAPWLKTLAGQLASHFGTTVETRVSNLITDPWTLHAPSAHPVPQEANT